MSARRSNSSDSFPQLRVTSPGAEPFRLILAGLLLACVPYLAHADPPHYIRDVKERRAASAIMDNDRFLYDQIRRVEVIATDAITSSTVTLVAPLGGTGAASNPITVDPSSVTLQSNTFNTNGRLLKLDGGAHIQRDLYQEIASTNPITASSMTLSGNAGVAGTLDVDEITEGGSATLTNSITGNAGTATALAANGTNCAAESFPLGVNASGAVESCSTSISGNSATATAAQANGSNCSAGSFPLGVDTSWAAESCTDAATQAELDAHMATSTHSYLASTQAFTGGNTFNSSFTVRSNGETIILSTVSHYNTATIGASGLSLFGGANGANALHINPSDDTTAARIYTPDSGSNIEIKAGALRSVTITGGLPGGGLNSVLISGGSSGLSGSSGKVSIVGGAKTSIGESAGDVFITAGDGSVGAVDGRVIVDGPAGGSLTRSGTSGAFTFTSSVTVTAGAQTAYSVDASSGLNAAGYFVSGVRGLSLVCPGGQYPNAVTISSGVLTAGSCGTPAGSGDAVLAATQTWSGANTFNSSTTHAGLMLNTGQSSFTYTGANNVSVAFSSAAMLGDVAGGKEGAISYAQSVGDLHVGSGTVHMTGWKTYTPTWTGSGSNPAIGNGTLTGRYTQVGKLVTFQVRMLGGNTTTFGSGNYFFSTPTTMLATIQIDARIHFGSWYGLDASAGLEYGGFLHKASDTTVRLRYHSAATDGLFNSTVQHSAPFTWDDPDIIFLEGTYEAQ